jgi:hypothetical protein
MTECDVRHTAPSRFCLALTGLLLVYAVLVAPPVACAETRISGTGEAVRVEARGATLEEVLAALAGKFDLRYRAKVPLGRPVDGVFAGSLSRVIARLLEGYDRVVKSGPAGIEVIILGVSQRSSAAAEPS